MSIVFSGISFANMINLPFSAGLCATGIDGGWPMVFYVPGGLGLLWCLIFKFLCFSTPQNHPWISDLEKIYLVTSCKVIIFTIQKYKNASFYVVYQDFHLKAQILYLIVSQHIDQTVRSELLKIRSLKTSSANQKLKIKAFVLSFCSRIWLVDATIYKLNLYTLMQFYDSRPPVL